MSYVQKQNYSVAFTGGVDTKTDPKQVLAGNLLSLQNARFTNPGAIEKRTGFTKLGNLQEPTSNGQITSGQALQDFNNELLLFDNTNIYSYIKETGNWINKGTAISTIVNNTKITRMNTAQQENPDMAYLNGIEVYAYEDTRNSGSVRYAVIDTVSGNIIVPDSELAASSSQPKCISFSGKIYIFYQTASTLNYVAINPSTPTVVSSVTASATDGYTTGFAYDISVINAEMYIGYFSSHTASGEIDLFYYSSLMSKSAVTTVETGANTNNSFITYITVAGDSSHNVWINWCGNGFMSCAIYTYGLVSTVLAATGSLITTGGPIAMIESNTSNVMLFCLQINNAVSWKTQIVLYTLNTSGSAVAYGNLRSVGLASKPFNANGNQYINVAYDSSSTTTNLQCTYFTIMLSDIPFTVVAKMLPGVGGGLRTNSLIAEVSTISTNIFKFANSIKSPVVAEGGTDFTVLGVNSTQLDFEDPDKYIAVQFSNNLLIVGGILQSYDGVSVVEQGFNYYPEGITVTPSGSDGYLSTGTYSYCACYAWTDNVGNIQRSAPSPIVVVNVTATNHVTVVVPTYRITKKQAPRANVVIEIYRTQANAAGINPLFQLVTSILAPLQNSLSADTVSFVDLESDTNLATNLPLYTTGGILTNDAAPACSMMTLYNDRVILGGLEESNTLWYSQNRTELDNFNTAPVEFCATNTIGVDPRGGPITAIGLLNQNLIIFKKTQLFYVNGSGPDNTGQGPTFPDAQQIASDVGCANPNSVVITPAGLMFQSDKGIYILGTGLAYPTYIGAPVQGLLDGYQISSSTLSADKNLVIFTTTNDNTLVYDYYVGQWAIDTNQPAIDSTIYQNLFTYITSDGYVYQNNPNSYTDDTSPIYLSFTTPWLSFAQLNGYQRVFRAYILGTYEGTHTLDVTVAYDYNPAITYTTTVTPSATPPYEFRIDFNQQKCTSIQLTITDHQTSGYNQGYAISAITFVCGIMPGAARVPASSQYGTS